MNKGDWGKVKAFFDLSISVPVEDQQGEATTSDLTIKGFKLVDGVDGLFVGFPSAKGADGEWYDTIWGDGDVKNLVKVLALEKYNEEELAVGDLGDGDIPF